MQSELDHAGSDRLITQPVHQDESAHALAMAIRLKWNRSVNRKCDHTNLIYFQKSRCKTLPGHYIHTMFDRSNRCHSLACVQLEKIRSATDNRVFRETHRHCFKLIAQLYRVSSRRDHISARDIEFIF